jgi:3-isopropylmalate dehydrogenase
MYVDACSMHLVTEPARFDVILTEILFGDILSDEAGVLTGSLGMLSSATIGGPVGLYEPVHGSAPKLAGKNIANPIGAILSAALLLRYSAKNEAAAVAIEEAVRTVLDTGAKTRDIYTDGDRLVSTEEMGSLIREAAVEAANCRYAYHAV